MTDYILIHFFDIFLTICGCICGWLISAVYHHKSLHRKTICYTTSSELIFRRSWERIPELALYHKTEKLLGACRSGIAVWNNGIDLVDAKDVSVVNPLRFGHPSIRILWLGLPTPTRTVIAPKITISDDHHFVDVSFDFLDAEDGLCFEILYVTDHNGPSIQEPLLEGTIRGMRGQIPFVSMLTEGHSIFGTLAFICAACAMAVGTIALIFELLYEQQTTFLAVIKIACAVVFFLFALAFAIVAALRTMKNKKNVVPNALRGKFGNSAVDIELLTERIAQ